MDALVLREPFSALSHAVGSLLAVPGTILLWRYAGGDPTRRRSAMIYGLSLMYCYAASAQYHAAAGSPESIAFLRRLDHIGIHFLIAGTYTAMAGTLLTYRWRRWTLILSWLGAALGSGVLLIYGILPTWLSTAVYMGMGWGAYIIYVKIRRRHPHRDLRPLLLGGLFYSVGALINLAGRPAPLPGIVGSHELFHLFVLAGSLVHYDFVLGVVAPSLLGRVRLRVGTPHLALAGTPLRPRLRRAARLRLQTSGRPGRPRAVA